ncbi:universal stress protein [Streptomyces sp. NBC_01343]|uniref:universal stress protein n=1 Tax=Streptomyces sp. NBC_01343 TaxID=2903832 RepID=UPI002E10182E|nr:universal stress protein [Streptomyces sp. NBC_01343]
MKDRVSVGVDGSEESRAAARWAAQEAVVRQVPLRLVNCPLRAVHGWKMPPAYDYVPFFDPDNGQDIGRSVTHMVDDMLLPWHLPTI